MYTLPAYAVRRMLRGLNWRFSFFVLLLIFFSCTMRLKSLLIARADYNGNEFRIDGYYYYYWLTQDKTYFEAYFFYENGVIYHTCTVGTNELEIENYILSEYHLHSMNNVPYRWGVFCISENENEIIYSGWAPSEGGVYPAFKEKWKILNDTTLYSNKFDRTLYFKEFSPKPDSINRFIE